MDTFAIPSTGVASNREHSAQTWGSLRERITQLYSTEDRSLDEVITVIQSEYGFTATYVHLQHAKDWAGSRRVLIPL